MIEDRRKTLRHKALKGARIVFNGGYSSFECTVRNLSERGARLDVGNVAGLPADFLLQFSDGRTPRECRVRWRNASAIGVELKVVDPSESPDTA